uniref:Putative ovule protein n=1 Tax=Solanum chacoense TaxID=4108 RepID=A0A0V0HY02_SOLCH
MANSSLVAAIPHKKKVVAVEKESSILSISFEPPKHMMKKKGKASSVISGAELREKPKTNNKKGKSGSVLSDSIVSKESSCYIDRPKPKDEKPKLKLIELEFGDKEKPINEKKKKGGTDSPTTKVVDEKSITIKPNKGLGLDVSPKERQTTVIGKPMLRNNGGFDYGGPKGLNGKFVFGGPLKAHSVWSDSEVGPSPSEVAAAIAEKKYPLEEEKSSVLDGWSIDESVEGLRSKLERWRTELPPLYDRGMASSSYHSTGRHTRRHTDGGSGLFSCFGNFYGYECQCVCGKPKRRRMNPKFQSPSVGSRSWV